MATSACGGSQSADPDMGSATEATATDAQPTSQPIESYADAMAREHAGETPVATPMADSPALTAVVDRVVYFEGPNGPVEGVLVVPASGGAGPAIVLVHEWWGLNQNIVGVAERLAGEGYRVLAVDLYGGEFAEDAGTARSLMEAAMADPDTVVANTSAAADYLRSSAEASAVGVLGFCLGGGVSLNTGLNDPEGIDAVVVFYGHVPTDAESLMSLDAPLLGHFGALDGGIPIESVQAFDAALQANGADAVVHIYDDADHAFANPSGERYQAEAAELAWARTMTFLNETLSGE